MVEHSTDNRVVSGSIPLVNTKTQEKKEIQVQVLSRPSWASSSKWLKHRAQLKGLLSGSSYPTVKRPIHWARPRKWLKGIKRQPIVVYISLDRGSRLDEAQCTAQMGIVWVLLRYKMWSSTPSASKDKTGNYAVLV